MHPINATLTSHSFGNSEPISSQRTFSESPAHKESETGFNLKNRLQMAEIWAILECESIAICVGFVFGPRSLYGLEEGVRRGKHYHLRSASMLTFMIMVEVSSVRGKCSLEGYKCCIKLKN